MRIIPDGQGQKQTTVSISNKVFEGGLLQEDAGVVIYGHELHSQSGEWTALPTILEPIGGLLGCSDSYIYDFGSFNNINTKTFKYSRKCFIICLQLKQIK